ncbi:MAG: hypothetical protein KQH67_04585 [Bacteroidetes bacterium]|nr:hypothetical protein [Bacteroidota bacterium]
MKAKKRHTVYILSLLIAALSITSCSSVGDIPKDDIYYSRNSDNSGVYNEDEFQKSAESYGSKTVTSNVSSSDSFDYNSSYQDDVAGSETSDEYEYIDEYYDGSYESRLERFGSSSSSSSFGYYDNYYSGYNNCYSCYGGPNISFGFGMGYGYGMGYGMSYGYGWPYYSYYPSWYYPSYYYPYYGYNSYWSGYNAGYNAGYWNGYYGYPYGGGYYNDYGYSPAVAYGPRNSRVGGTNIPRNRSTSSGGSGISNQKSEVVSGGALNPIARDGSIIARDGSTVTSRGESTVTTRDGQATNGRNVSGNTGRIGKPGSDVTYRRDANDQGVVKGSRSGSQVNRQPEKVYQKPKSYQNLSTQQSKSRSEYVRPTNKTEVGKVNQNRTSNVRTNPTTPRDINNSGSSRKGIYTPSRTRSSSYERSTPSKSYSSPSRSNTSSRSYSSPSSTRSGSGSSKSVGSSRSSNISSSSSSRSSSGSSSSSRSSGSSSRGGGGSPGRR